MKSENDASVYTFETRKLVEMGLLIAVNHTWSYAEMESVCGRAVDGSTSSVQAALRRLARDHGVEFKNLRGKGYLRLDDPGIVEMAPRDRASIRRRIGRAARRSANIRSWRDLDPLQQREVETHRSVLSVLRHTVKAATVRRIGRAVQAAKDELPIERTLELFRNK